MPMTLMDNLQTLAQCVGELGPLYAAETRAWKAATLATTARMANLHVARSAVANAMDLGLDFPTAMKLLESKGLLPGAEAQHFTKAYRNDSLDIPRFKKYLRAASNITSTPSKTLNEISATPPEPVPVVQETPMPTVRFRTVGNPDFTTMKAPAL